MQNRTNPTVTRRRLMRGTAIAAAGGMTALGGSRLATAASTRFSAPAVIRQQDAPVEIDFVHIWGTAPGGAEKETKHPAVQLIDAFNAKNTGVKVNSRTDSGNYQETLVKVQAELAAGNAPALVTTPWAGIHHAVEGLGINDLDSFAGDQLPTLLGNLRDEVIPLVQIDGKTYGIPFAFSCPVFYYNTEIFSQVGIGAKTVFSDWPTYGTEIAKITEATGNPAMCVNINQDWPAQALIQCNGGQIYNDDGELQIDSPEAIEALHVFADLCEQGLYFKSAADEVRPAFTGGSLAIITGSIASLSGITTASKFEVGTAAYPVFPGKARKMPSGGSFIGSYARDDEQKQASLEFLNFVVSEEAIKIWMQTGYLNASKYEVPLLPGQDVAYEQLKEGLTPETPWPGSRATEIQTTWGEYVNRIWMNDISVEEGVAEAKSEMEAMV